MEIEHTKVIKNGIIYCGGNQSWFDAGVRKTACGMIAACDMALRPENGNCQPVPFEEYRLYVIEKAKNFFYKNRLNIFGIPAKRIVEFLNTGISEQRFRFMSRRKLTENTLRQIIEKSLKKGLPVIIRVGENGSKLEGRIRFGSENSAFRQSAIRWHYITAVGIENDTLIFYSWGRKGEMKLSELYKHFGFTGGIIAAE